MKRYSNVTETFLKRIDKIRVDKIRLDKMKRYSNVSPANMADRFDYSRPPQVEWSGKGAMEQDEERQIIRSDHEPAKPLVLVPDGTICFCAMIATKVGADPDDIRITGFETVWLKPNDDGVWEGVGPVSGHTYRHIGWLRGLQMQQQAAAMAWRQALEREAERQKSRRWRIKRQYWRLVWWLRGCWYRVRYR